MTPLLARLMADPRARRALRIGGWILLGLFSFVIALQATFPYQRVADKAVEVLSPRYEVTIGDVERGWLPGKMILRAVTLRSRPTKPDDVVTTTFFERVEIDVNLLASLFGRRFDTDLELAVGGGTLGGSIAVGKQDLYIDLEGKDMPATGVPGLVDAIGLPMSGKIDPLVELELPGGDWRQAKGRIRLVCAAGCTVGDGVTKLKFKLKPGSRQAAFASEGVTIDKMFIDRFVLQVDIANSKLSITTWELKSKDLEATIELQVQLAKSIAESTVTSGCVRYKPSDELSQRAPKTQAALMSTGAPLAPDGNYNILLSGRLSEMKRLPRVCGAAGAGDSGDGAPTAGRTRRPSLGKGPGDDTGGGVGGGLNANPVPPMPEPMRPDDVNAMPQPDPNPPPIGAGAGSGVVPPSDAAPGLTGATPPPAAGNATGAAATPPPPPAAVEPPPSGVVPADPPPAPPPQGEAPAGEAPPAQQPFDQQQGEIR